MKPEFDRDITLAATDQHGRTLHFVTTTDDGLRAVWSENWDDADYVLAGDFEMVSALEQHVTSDDEPLTLTDFRLIC